MATFFSKILSFCKQVIRRFFGKNEDVPLKKVSGDAPVSKFWLDQYEQGIPEFIEIDQYNSLNEIFNASCSQFSQRIAYSNMGVKLSYAEIDELSKQFAAWLQDEAKIKKGDRVALMLPNTLQYPVALFGALRVGAVVVNVNPMYSPRELEHQLNDSGAQVIIILENFAHTLEKVMNKVKLEQVVVTSLGDLFPFPKSKAINFLVSKVKRLVPKWNIEGHSRFNKVLAKGKQLSVKPVYVKHDDIAFLQYTGGTTGVSKGVMLSHKNMIANILQASLWSQSSMQAKEKGIMITALPLYHIFALTAAFFMPLKIGMEVMLITNPRDFSSFIKRIKKVKFSAIIGVNTLFNAMLNTNGFDEVDFSKLKTVIGAGMAVTKDVAQRWQQLTGCVVTQGYGLTETSPVVTVNPLNTKAFNGSIGVPVSSTEVAIMDDSGNHLAIGEAGEICIRGPQVMQGYWQRPEETEKVFFDNGWFRSGDIGHMNEKGYVYLADRKKDLIIVSGFNVYPNEVEDVLTLHPMIIEAAVIGVPHKVKGEVVKAYIVHNSKEDIKEEIIEYCRKHLAAYKIPTHIEYRLDLPKNNVGKVLRRELRDEAKTKAVE